MKLSHVLNIAIIAILTTTSFAAPYPKLTVAPVDPLENVFRDSDNITETSATAEVARGQHAEFQLVARRIPVPITDLRCSVPPFSTSSGNTLDSGPVRFVGYVASSFTAKKAAKDQLRKAPAVFPDPLLEQDAIDVHENDNQPIWLSVPVPADATPGDYYSTATVTAKIFGEDTTATIPLSIKVYPATVASTRLKVVMWFQMWHRGSDEMPEKFSPQWWDILRMYAKNMVEHRQNWARVETLWLVKYTRNASGELDFDYTHFDQWVQILLDAGITNIESLQYAWRSGKWDEPYHVEVHNENDSFTSGTKVPVDSAEAEAFYSRFFPSFHDHLKEKGWLDKFVQHVGDEPVAKNAESYIKAAGFAKKYMPEVPIMEACLANNMVGTIDIWVPTIENLGKHFDFFKERKASGDRVWFYNCVQPQGDYANRFAELPWIKTRLTHWVNYRYDIEGYLHWGYNFWRKHPWDNIASKELPGGDTHIVYPAKEGYGIVESVRYEAMRDGIEDHELLSQLGEKDPAKAMELATRHIRGWADYDTNLKTFRQTRRELLEALSQQQK